ncbi:MAG: hypothetical protein KF823_10310 [Xanthomonadales bacterium]|nr:hypothetical protein [Xanthomonadales bacterium]
MHLSTTAPELHGGSRGFSDLWWHHYGRYWPHMPLGPVGVCCYCGRSEQTVKAANNPTCAQCYSYARKKPMSTKAQLSGPQASNGLILQSGRALYFGEFAVPDGCPNEIRPSREFRPVLVDIIL